MPLRRLKSHPKMSRILRASTFHQIPFSEFSFPLVCVCMRAFVCVCLRVRPCPCLGASVCLCVCGFIKGGCSDPLGALLVEVNAVCYSYTIHNRGRASPVLKMRVISFTRLRFGQRARVCSAVSIPHCPIGNSISSLCGFRSNVQARACNLCMYWECLKF